MELIIVVAIMAVLVAVITPFFMNKIEKAREAYDITTMRQAAEAATELLYSGIDGKEAAEKAGMHWWPYNNDDTSARSNAAGAYDPTTGEFCETRQKLPKNVKRYGKGTAQDGKTTLIMGNPAGAYKSDEDYTNAVIMVAIYPNANPSYAMVYWKNNVGNSNYVGGEEGNNVPKYSIKITLE